MDTYDICIIGGGASGMTAALSAASLNSSVKVVIIEKKRSSGKETRGDGKRTLQYNEYSLCGI